MRLARATAPAGSALAFATVEVGPLDPIALYEAAVGAGLEAALWLRPDAGRAIVGIGRAWAAEAEGPDRIAEVDRAWRALAAGLGAAGPDIRDGERRAGVPGGPVLLGGLGFDGRHAPDGDVWSPFARASLVLPELAVTIADGVTALTVAVACRESDVGSVAAARWASIADQAGRGETAVADGEGPALRVAAERPDRAEWERLVGLFAGAVGRGRLDKVVLARRVDLVATTTLDVPRALRRLVEQAPESAVYAFSRGGRTFLGATPERLVSTDGRAFRTVAIASSAPRGADATEDLVFARALLASDKEREEHAVVVTALRERLSPLAERLSVAPRPGILKLRHVQHLVTEVEGVLRERAGLLALAALLHPTPAVGGEPTDLALGLIAEHEGFDRGWYAGPVGWLDAGGDGELMVALRCAVVDGTRASLFAGCGIVADSDPAREWEESCMKLRAMTGALGTPGACR